jgi:enoyl-CoA hydratase/carnithine racemase
MLACMSRLTADAPVLVGVDGPVGRLTLNRPQKRNALGLEFMQELIAGLGRLGADPGVQVIVVDARGPAFCAGH